MTALTPEQHARKRRTQALNALRRKSNLKDADDLLRWAASKTDEQLLYIRNFGLASLRWVRSQPVPPGPAPIPEPPTQPSLREWALVNADYRELASRGLQRNRYIIDMIEPIGSPEPEHTGRWKSAESTLNPDTLEGSQTLRDTKTGEFRVYIDGPIEYVSRAVHLITGETNHFAAGHECPDCR